MQGEKQAVVGIWNKKNREWQLGKDIRDECKFGKKEERTHRGDQINGGEMRDS